jgi:hypothetical protein
MKLPRRQFLHLAAGAVALPAVSRIASAQVEEWTAITPMLPNKPSGVPRGPAFFGRLGPGRY